MEPLRLQGKNFLCYSEFDISFSEWSTAVIIGKIKDNDKLSNGAGKTTIFHAIIYALFNKTHLSSIDKIVRHDTSHCKIIFDFISSLDNQTYRIERSRGKTTGEVKLFRFENNEWSPLTGETNKDTEKEIAKIIKINYKTFCNSVLFSHLDLLQGLANLETSKRKVLLKEVLQLAVYSKYEISAKKKASDLLKNIDKETTISATLGNPIEDIKIFNFDFLKVQEELDSETKNLCCLNNLYNDKNIEYVDYLSKLDELKKQNIDIITKQNQLKSDINKLSSVYSDYNNKSNLIKSTGKLLSEDISKLKFSLKEDKNILATKNKDLIDKKIKQVSNDIIEQKNIIYSCNAKLKELNIPIPAGGVCSHCRKIITDEDRIVCQKQIDLEIKSKKNESQISTGKLKELEEVYLSLNKEIKLIENIENKIKNNSQKLQLAEKEIETKRTIYSEYIDILEKTNKSLEEKKFEFSSLKDISVNENLINKLLTTIKETKLYIDKLSTNINDINEKIISLSNKKAVLEHKIKSRTEDIGKIKIQSEKISSLEKLYTIHQKVAQAFSSGGIPALIVHTILDDFQIDANNYLTRFMPGLQLKFLVIKDKGSGDQEDTMDIKYILNGRDLEYDQLSGAQKLIVSLSLKLGLASVMKNRLGTEIKMLLIDEVDQSLDEGRVEVFEDAIKQLQKDFKILLITHNRELKDKFNTAIIVEQDENFVSTARVANNW